MYLFGCLYRHEVAFYFARPSSLHASFTHTTSLQDWECSHCLSPPIAAPHRAIRRVTPTPRTSSAPRSRPRMNMERLPASRCQPLCRHAAAAPHSRTAAQPHSLAQPRGGRVGSRRTARLPPDTRTDRRGRLQREHAPPVSVSGTAVPARCGTYQRERKIKQPCYECVRLGTFECATQTGSIVVEDRPAVLFAARLTLVRL